MAFFQNLVVDKYMSLLDNQVCSKDKEINQTVYKLYELTEEEIKIVEGC